MTNDVDELQREVKRLRGVVKKLVIPKEITKKERRQMVIDMLQNELGITIERIVLPQSPGNYNMLYQYRLTLPKPISEVNLRHLSGHNDVYHQVCDNTGITRILTRIDANVEMVTADNSLQIIAPCVTGDLKFGG